SLFLFTATAATEISTLSLHDALPIYIEAGQGVERAVDAVLVPIAIVAQEPVDELVDALDAHAARRVKAGILPEQLLARRVVQIAVIGIVELDLAVPHGVRRSGLLPIHVVHLLVADIGPVDRLRVDLVASAVVDENVLLG